VRDLESMSRIGVELDSDQARFNPAERSSGARRTYSVIAWLSLAYHHPHALQCIFACCTAVIGLMQVNWSTGRSPTVILTNATAIRSDSPQRTSGIFTHTSSRQGAVHGARIQHSI
jgi:hypothetical protein